MAIFDDTIGSLLDAFIIVLVRTTTTTMFLIGVAVVTLPQWSSSCHAWSWSSSTSSPTSTSMPMPSSTSLFLGGVGSHRRSPNTQTTGRRLSQQQYHHPCLTAAVGMMMISNQQLGKFACLEEWELDVPLQCDRRVALLDYTTAPTAAVTTDMDQDDDDDDDDDVKEESFLIDFETAWEWQKVLMQRHFDRLMTMMTTPTTVDDGHDDDDSDGTVSPPPPSSFWNDDNPVVDKDVVVAAGRDTVLMLQHHPVYTLGTGSDEKFVLDEQDGTAAAAVPVVRMDRGGEVTYHGPGQLTVYPILDLRSYRQDIHWYMRALEEATITALTRCGIDSNAIERQDDVTGVWVDNCKVAAVGIKCRRWVTMHGVAINVEDRGTMLMSTFDGIVPCGLEGRKVGCINQFLRAKGQPEISVQEFATVMREALEEVFRITMIPIAIDKTLD